MTDEEDLSIPDFLKRTGPPAPITTPLKWVKDIIAQERKVVVEKKVAPVKVSNFKPDVQKAIREKNYNIIGEIEGMIDDGLSDSFSMYSYLSKNEMSKMVALAIVAHFTPRKAELDAVLNNPDLDLKEGYKDYSKDEIRKMAALFESFIADAKRYNDNTKVMRKARKKKLPSVERILKDVKYAQSNEKYKVASVDPATVIGAQELWAFNTAQMLVTHYVALDRGGLTFKGSNIVNFDEKKTRVRRLGHKAEDKLKTILTAGKRILDKLMTDLKGDDLKPTRITKQTILLRVIK